jgi:hypothetical protein
MPDYSKTIIYKIRCLDDVDFSYVGHTTNFRSRKSRHKNSWNNKNVNDYDMFLYQKIRELGGWEKFEMIPLEEYTICKSLIEARIREQEWIEKLKPNLNIQKAYTELKDSEYNKQYYIENADKIKDNVKNYKLENADELKEKAKQYYIENCDRIKEANAKRYAEKRDEINEKRRKKRAENV